MSKIGLMDKGSDQLDARSSVAGTDRLALFTSDGTEPELATVDEVMASATGLLDNDNTFTGDNTFEGTSDFDGNVDVLTGTTINIADLDALTIGSVAVEGSAAELNVVADVTAGTVAASKAVVVDASLHQDVIHTASLNLGATGATVAVTATALEINRLDDSAETEEVTAAGAISVVKTNTNLDSTIATFAATLAACPATMIGKIKTIRMSADNGDVTLALTEVQGGTAATTATFTDVTDELILIGSAGGKWTVVKEFGVTLS